MAELADRCETSTTSVVRFYKRMGYSHYKDLLMDLTREAMRQEMATSSLPPLSGDIGRNDSLEDIVAKVAINETLSISDTARALDTKALGQAVRLLTDPAGSTPSVWAPVRSSASTCNKNFRASAER